jgi:hypothetical protein
MDPKPSAAFEAECSGYEIHVVSTDNWMPKPIQSWKQSTINYHCFQSGDPCFLGAWMPVDLPKAKELLSAIGCCRLMMLRANLFGVGRLKCFERM